jgi:gp16 family phage-associated protein
MTADEIKKKFIAEGRTISGWARANGFAPPSVYRVLNGYDLGVRGQAHEIAVLIGLKPQPIDATDPSAGPVARAESEVGASRQ